MKNFTIYEIADSEAPMIGTITNVVNTPESLESFKNRLIAAIAEHFDNDDFRIDEIPDLFTGSSYDDIMIEIDGLNYEIRIVETWLY